MKKSPFPSPTRRSLLMAAAALPLAACDSISRIDFNTMKQMVAIDMGLEDAPAITLEQAAQVPYATLGYRIGGSEENMLILAVGTGGNQLWTSSAHRALVTNAGRIIKTAGLPWNLSATQFRMPDTLRDGLHITESTAESLRVVDFADLNLFSIAVYSRFRPAGTKTIRILGSELSTIALVENCRSPELDWSFQNEFWLDPATGFNWRSVQTIHPNLDPLTIEILRPPA